MQSIDKNLFVRNSKLSVNINLDQIGEVVDVLVEMEYPISNDNLTKASQHCDSLVHLVGHAYRASVKKEMLKLLSDLDFVFFIELKK